MKKYFFLFLVVFCFFSRFYGLLWGAPFFFHPDERNIASAVSQLHIPQNTNPHFFAYGSLPIYSIYFLSVFENIFRIFQQADIFTVSFDQAIITGRFFSAFFSLSTLYLLYLIGKKLHNTTLGLFTVFLGATSVGLIQFAHFATFEMWLTYFSLLLAYRCLYYGKHPSKRNLILLSLVLGVLVSIKISSLVFFFPVFISLAVTQLQHKKRKILVIKDSLYTFFSVLLIAGTVYIFTNPFVFLDTSSFLGSMHYETSVATGSLPVFYTQGFSQTIPVVYQILFVYPFLLNLFGAILFIPATGYVLGKAIKQKNVQYLLLCLFFFTIFFSQAILFVKWTRYMVPTLPFVYLFIAITIFDMLSIKTSLIITIIKKFCVFSFFLFSIGISSVFIYTVYMQKYSSVVAYEWAKRNIPTNSNILSEVYDLGIVPFNNSYSHITLFNFYDLEIDPSMQTQLKTTLEKTEYIVLPSQRIIKNRIMHPQTFPKGNKFYTKLLEEKRFKKIYETPCDISCKILYNFNPVFHLEETATVFDHPTVYIYKKK